MIKHIFKIIWAQRKNNAWIFAELLVVVAILWTILDRFWVDIRTYHSPLGYDITNVWRFNLSVLGSQAPGYIPDSLFRSNQTADLLQLIENIRRQPAVEEVCLAYYSCPYSFGNSWWSISPVEGDSLAAKEKSFQVRHVSPEYFKVFRVTDTEGKPVYPSLQGLHNPTVISADMEKLFFHDKPGKGQKVIYRGSEEERLVAAVCTPIRTNEYARSEPCYFDCMDGPVLNRNVNQFGAENSELCVRTKRSMSQEQMNRLLDEMAERLTVENLTVYSVTSLSYYRDSLLKSYQDEANKKVSFMVFLMINVFFGIIGTFWLRTQRRKGEIGLRIALGSNRRHLKRLMYLEGLGLLSLTLPFILLFMGNIIYLDLLDSYRLPLSVGRFFLIGGASYLMMAVLITMGIWFPVRKAVRMAPAEALHYE